MPNDEKNGTLLQIVLHFAEVAERTLHTHHPNLMTCHLADDIASPCCLNLNCCPSMQVLVLIGNDTHKLVGSPSTLHTHSSKLTNARHQAEPCVVLLLAPPGLNTNCSLSLPDIEHLAAH